MSDFIEKQKNELEDYVNKWEKAQKDGIFNSSDMPNVNRQTSTGSFFGFTQTNPTDSPNLTDTQYWSAINSAADDHDNITTINEQLKHKDFPSNPLSKDSFGCDQKMSPQSLGQTYTEEELQTLTELKKELYELEVKLLNKLGFGDYKNKNELELKIESLKEKIHKISDDMGVAYKNDSKTFRNY